jgi:hypothetical protein
MQGTAPIDMGQVVLQYATATAGQVIANLTA